MINYILQVVLFQAIFLALYDLFLQKETFFKWNRIYLLITPLVSFVIPFLKFETLKNTVSQEYIEQLPTVFLNPQVLIEQTNQHSSSLNYLAIIFYSGAMLFALLFLIRLTKLFKLITSSKIIKKSRYSIVLLEDKQAAFSFFNYIFVHKQLLESEDLQIIKHELIHCNQKHTFDLLLFELLKIVLWFNPLVYIFQKRITVLHEYISDAEVVSETDKKTYFNNLLAQTFNVENISFINQFFKHSLIKKRIIMITKEKSQRMKQLKYLLVIPLLVSMLVYVSCTNDTQTDIDEMNRIIENEVIYSNGNYFEGKNGIKIFTGSYLAGQVIPFNEMTEREKEIFNNFNNLENSKIEYRLVIDTNGDRVHFLKVPMPPMKNEVSDKIAIEDDGSVPFAVIEDTPIYPGCEGTKEELRMCLQEKITEHVNRNFNTDLAKGLGLKAGVKRIFVMFKIDNEGNISDVKARAPHKALQEEAIRVVNSLPKMKPGSYLGENVGVKYSLPIAFKVE
ncbi:MAG: BlaR1 peptidase M56 [Lutibacter sp.]|uniref:M56 family metallopeptidase n=1 Tax=Lutibacter sp. TaxID=1925666 RepID=UPI0019FCEFF5|nr:M56 family metallopeptidase [Lutibacter sp.]NOR28916.1 BlaR1 peptidase M56 [Lutibacter sp.]